MQITGQTQTENKLLEMAFVPDAIYVPPGKNHLGGLFDNNLKPIPQAVSRRDRQIWLSKPLANQAIDVGRLPQIQSDKPYFFIGDVKDHFGHFLLESTSRLWPLLYLPPAFAGQYLYCSKNRSPAVLEKPFIKEIFACFSLSPQDFVAYQQPCRIKNVFVAAPAFEIRLQGRPIFRQSMQHVGNTLAGNLSEINNTNLTPVYLSKSKLVGGVSRIINEVAIEESLRRKGVDIWHPETVGLAEQVRELSRRKYIMGSVGSAFHTLLCCPGGKVISGINLGEKLYSSYIIIDELCGNVGKYESGENVGISLSTDAGLDKKSSFINTFYAANPGRFADTLLRNMGL